MSALQSESSSFGGLPNGRPQRAPRMTCGAWVMFSVPPASTTFASPVRICSAALTTAWKPEPHRRFTVSAGTRCGTPAFSPTWRAQVDGVGRGLEHVAEDDVVDVVGGDAGALERGLRGATARSVAVRSFSAPPKVPNGGALAGEDDDVARAMSRGMGTPRGRRQL